MVRRFRAIYRTRGSRRILRRRTYRTTRRARSNRIYRRFIRRSAVKPELKWVVGTNNGEVAASTAGSVRGNPATLPIGTGVSQRIGNKIKTIRCDVNLTLINNSLTTLPNAAPARQQAQTRYILWAPRTSYSTAVAYMNNLGIATHVDFSYVTVYRDSYLSLSPPYMAEATSNDIAGGPSPYMKTIRMKLKWPRSVTFTDDNGSDLVNTKYALYLTVVNSYLATAYSITTKMWYFDA